MSIATEMRILIKRGTFAGFTNIFLAVGHEPAWACSLVETNAVQPNAGQRWAARLRSVLAGVGRGSEYGAPAKQVVGPADPLPLSSGPWRDVDSSCVAVRVPFGVDSLPGGSFGRPAIIGLWDDAAW